MVSIENVNEKLLKIDYIIVCLIYILLEYLIVRCY